MKHTLTISNWNLERIHPSQKRLSEIRRYFSESDANIWFLTETHIEVSPSEGFFPCFSGSPERHSEEGERWVAIWSRWPVEPLDEFVSDPTRCAAGIIQNSPFGELMVYGTVLPWSNDWRGIPGVNGQAFEAALDLQKRDWLALKEKFPNATLILAGDFNQDLASWHYYGSKRKRSLLESALLECELIALTSGTSDPIARNSSPMACIDHICISAKSDWNLDSTTRWPNTSMPIASLSDHFGVSIQITL